MGRFALILAGFALSCVLAGCNTRGQASIPEDLSPEEERIQEAELKAIRAEEAKAPRDGESEKDDP